MSNNAEKYRGKKLGKPRESERDRRRLREEILTYMRPSIDPYSKTEASAVTTRNLAPFYTFNTPQEVFDAPTAVDPYTSWIDTEAIVYSPATALLFLRTRHRLERNKEGLPEYLKKFQNDNQDKLRSFPQVYRKKSHRASS